MRDHTSLLAWQAANRLAVEVYRIATDHWSAPAAAAWSQIRRASLSVPLNIAEGYLWRPGARWRFHLRVANGSALETGELLWFLVEVRAMGPETAAEAMILADRSGRLIWGLQRRA